MILRLFEPHEKSNKMSVRPAKIQISLGIWVGAQADLSLCWWQSFLLALSCGRSFVLFSLDMGKETLVIYIRTNIKKLL